MDDSIQWDDAPQEIKWDDAPTQSPLAQLSPQSTAQDIAYVPNAVLNSASKLSQEGFGESLQNFAESTFAQLKAGAQGLGSGLLDVGLNPGHLADLGGVADRAAEVAKASLKGSEKDILQPETPGGKEAQAILGLPAEWGAKTGEKTLDVTGSPLLATAADILTQNAPFMLAGVKGGVGKLRGAPVDIGLEALRKAAEPIAEPAALAPEKPVEAPVEKPHYTGEQVAAGEHLPEPEPTPAAQRAQRLTELDAQRGDLTPEQVQEHSDLQYQDRRQGKVGNNGAPMEGVGNAVALAENHDVEHALQVHTDIDNFKALNDTAGHPAGDVLIQHVGETLAREFPPDENGKPSVYHHGGDEFTIIPKPDETLAEVKKRVEDVREQVKNQPIELTDTKGETSVHPGVDFSVGAGEGHAAASESLASDKAAREASGIRRPRYNRSTDTPRAIEGAADRVAANPERPSPEVNGPRANSDTVRPATVADSGSGVEGVRQVPVGTEVRNAAVNAQREAVDPLPEVSARNAAIDESRQRMGLPPMEPAERKGWDKTREEAATIVKNDPNAAQKIIDDHKKTERPLTDAEQVVLAEHAGGIEKKWAAADEAVNAAKKSGDGIAEMRATADRNYYEAKAHEVHGTLNRGGGTAVARSLQIRNAILGDRYSIGRNMERAEATYGNLTDRLRNEARAHSQEIAKAKQTLEDLQNKQEKARAETPQKAKPRTRMTDEEREHATVQRQVADKLKKIQDLQDRVEKRLKACPI